MSTSRRPTATFLIGIAAELAGMHPQTLRVYERRGLITPRRSARNTRLYSQADVARLRRIQELSEEGMNLAGIERVLALEGRLERADELQDALERHREELAAARAARGQVVVAPAGGTALVRRYPLAVPRPRTTTTMGGTA